MKALLLGLFLISACANWKQRDFEKDLNKPSEEAVPAVATTAQDEKLLEKFQVQPVEEVKGEQLSVPQPEKEKVEIKKPIKIKDIPPVKASVPVSRLISPKKPPMDYPKEMLVLNDNARKVWSLYKPNHSVNQKSFLDINYMGMTVGKIMILNQGKKMINDKEVWHFHARFKSAPFYSNIYELDDTVDTYVTTDQFLSSRYSLIQRETKQDVDDLQLHDRDQFKTFWFYHQKKSDGTVKDKKEEKPIPYFSTDPFSVLFFYQGLPLKNGDIYEIPLINKGKVLLLRSVVEGREVIDTIKGKFKSIRVRATTKYTGETLKSGDLSFWFTDDKLRTLIKVKAKIQIGSVTADIADK